MSVRVEDRKPPFRIRFRQTGIRLEPANDGPAPAPGRTVVMASNGRLISANPPGGGRTISVWDARGRYRSSFGQVGFAPGEFSPGGGMLGLFIDGRDHLHVRDGPDWWSVFSPGHELVRRVPGKQLGIPGYCIVLDDGSAVASDLRGSSETHHFCLVDPAGAVRGWLGPVGDSRSGWGRRVLAHAGGDTFWAGPGLQGSDAYVLEEWGIDGELRRTVERDVSWWQWRGNDEISPAVAQLHVTSDGLLYVLVRRPTTGYVRNFGRMQGGRAPPPLTAEYLNERRARRDAGMEAIAEVIDPRSGELLASDTFPGTSVRDTIPRSLFRGSLTGYRYDPGDGGPPSVRIMKVELVPADAAGEPPPSG